jgi:hypothetical protein
MPDGSAGLSLLGLAGYLTIAYLTGRLLVGLVVASPSGLVRATSPILGGSAIAIQLWIYGAVHIPWNPQTILGPWVVVAIVRRAQLRRAITEDWRGILGEARLLVRSGPLEVVLLVALAVLGLLYLVNLVTQPVIGWDAVAMWLFKADLFYSQQAVNLAPIATDIRRHLDYPPLYPLMVDSLYGLAGHADDIFGKSVTYLFFPTSLIGFLITARDLLGRQLAIVFTFLLGAMPIFLNALFSIPYMGYADYPVGILMLVSLLHLVQGIRTDDHIAWSLAIVYAALAALTKNEGLSFLAIVLIVRATQYIIAAARQRRLFAPNWTLVAGVLFLSLAPLIGWQLYLKHNGIPADRVVSQSWLQLLPGLPGRAGATLASIRRHFSLRGDYPWLVVSYLLSVVLIALSRTPLSLTVLAAISMQLASYLVVYLITPFEIEFIVSTTMERLLLQLAPSLVLLLAAAVHPYLSAGVSDSPTLARTRVEAPGA